MVTPEPVRIVCAPAMDFVVRIAIALNADMSMLIAPAPDVSVVRFTPAINAVLKLAPVVMVCAPSPIVLITIFSILLRLVQRVSGGVIAPAPPWAIYSVSIPKSPLRKSPELKVSVPAAS
ncbi:hypothetical protein [Nostoc sp.]